LFFRFLCSPKESGQEKAPFERGTQIRRRCRRRLNERASARTRGDVAQTALAAFPFVFADFSHALGGMKKKLIHCCPKQIDAFAE